MEAAQYPITVTLFKDFGASTKTEAAFNLGGLAKRVLETTSGSKGALPWLKLARFGDIRTEKNSLRNDANVLEITGIEADYDGERVSVEEATERLEKAGILALVYTSPSHTEDSPRWRVLCPTSVPLPADRREKLMGRLNGLFGGVFSTESWTLSQAYYFGSVNRNPSHQVHLIDGQPIDDHDDLDEIWQGKPATVSAPGGGGGHSTVRWIDEAALTGEIISGASYHMAAIRLLGRWARIGVAFMEARGRLLTAFEAVPEDARDGRWKQRYEDIDRCLEDIYGAEAAQRDSGKRRPHEIEDPPSHFDEAPPLDAYHDAMSAEEWHDLQMREGGHSIPASKEAREQAGKDILWSITDPWDEADIPVRPWLARGYLMRKSITVVSGPGSAGKSSLMVAWAACGAMGCAFGRLKFRERLRVMSYNVEDNADEQKRRFSAIFRKMGLTPADAFGFLTLVGPEQVGTLLTFNREGGILVNTPVMDKLDDLVKSTKPNVLILDPFVELHAAEENDNTAVRAVMAKFRSWAIEHDMAVVILHHARKGAGTPGDPDSLRGASSIVGAARVAFTCNVMTEEEAKGVGIREVERRNYFRLDGAKSNYAPVEEAEWFERQEIILNNGGDGEDPDGVALAWPWKPPNVIAAMDSRDLNRALDIIATPPAGWLYMPDPRSQKSGRWAGTPIMEKTGCNEAQAQKLVKAWLASGLLYKETFLDPSTRQAREGVRVNDVQRPTTSAY